MTDAVLVTVAEVIKSGHVKITAEQIKLPLHFSELLLSGITGQIGRDNGRGTGLNTSNYYSTMKITTGRNGQAT